MGHTEIPSSEVSVPCRLQLSLPERCDGHPEKCRGFLLQRKLYFAYQTGNSTGREKVAAIVSVLAGRALEWVSALWERSVAEVYSYEDFRDLFRAVFDHPAQGKQRKEATEHALEFRTLASLWMEQRSPGYPVLERSPRGPSNRTGLPR